MSLLFPRFSSWIHASCSLQGITKLTKTRLWSQQEKNKQIFYSELWCFLVAPLKHIGIARMQTKSFHLVGFHSSSYYWWLCGYRDIFPQQKTHIFFRRNQQRCPKSRQESLKGLGRRKSPKAPHRWAWPPKISWLVSYLWAIRAPCLATLLQSCWSITYLLLIHYPGLPFGTCRVSHALGRIQKKKKTPRYLCLAWIYGGVRKCIFHVYEFSAWPCEATAVLVHKQHEEWVITNPKDQSSSPEGAFVFPFTAAPEASQPSLPMACALLTCDLLTIITGRAICNQTYNKDILVLRGSDNAPFSNFCAVSNLENEW